MITDEEKQEIVELLKEQCYLIIPEIVGNQMQRQITMHKINKKFYSDHPEFKGHADSVQSVVEMVEGRDNNTLLDHEQIMTKALPEIRQRINTLKNLDTQKVDKNPSRSFTADRLPNHGEL